jgi:hypothetical protein
MCSVNSLSQKDIAISPDGKARGFTRSPLYDDGEMRMRIKAVCDLCGHIIVGSVIETLVEDEQEHADNCPKKRLNPSSLQ